MRERGPLRHGGQRDLRQRHAYQESRGDRGDDPAVMHDLGLDPGRDDRDGHARDPGDHTAARRFWVVHPIQREDEQRRGEDGGELTDEMHHCFLNILSMRSVIMKPLTMFVIEAKSATAPRMRIVSGWSAPATTIEPTTAIAEMALVSDIRGVYSSRETRRITPSPMNVA